MEWVVTTGRTVDEAREAALDELGVAEDELELEVLDEPKAGLFGMVRREARVRARVAPAVPRPKAERRPRRGRGAEGKGSKGNRKGKGGRTGESTRKGKDAAGAGEADDAEGVGTADGTDAVEESPTGGRPARGRGRGGARRPAAEPTAEATSEETSEASEVADPSPPAAAEGDGNDGGATDEPGADDEGSEAAGGRRRSRGRGRGRSRGPRSAEGGTPGTAEEQGGKVSKVSVDEQAEVVEDFLDGLLEAFDLSGEIASDKVDDETIEVRVEGDDLGLLIGPKGQTLSAVQDLSRTVVQRRLAGSLEGRVRVDVGGYRQRRKAALERFAQQVAEDVLDSGSQKVLEPMSPPDRKIVHDVINEIDGVTTASEGEEPRRRVVVRPVDE